MLKDGIINFNFAIGSLVVNKILFKLNGKNTKVDAWADDVEERKFFWGLNPNIVHFCH